MMKRFLFRVLSLMVLAFWVSEVNAESIYDFTVQDIEGNDVSLQEYEGKILLIVNVASQCGVTDQYGSLQALHEVLHDRGVVVMGFPSNDFGGQEPGSNSEIKAFCETNYAVSFPLFAKISTEGEDQAALFRYLTQAENADFTGPIQWNFEKFLIGREGSLLRRFRSDVEPDGEEMIGALKEALQAGG
ncbi:MAG: glutathione peroxidase [Verrucomicrobiota bacterium]